MDYLCVYCGAEAGDDPRYAEAADRLGDLLVDRGFGLVYGGGSIGLMGVLADAVLRRGGEVVGVMPRWLVDKELAHRGLSDLVVVDSLHERKARMLSLARGFIALPGGLGTLEEFVEALTWAKLGLHPHPCGLLNVLGFFDPLLEFLDVSARSGFLWEPHRRMLLVADTAGELLDRFAAHRPPPPKRPVSPPD